MSNAAGWVDKLAGCSILVLGDLCLDEYIVGRSQRLSREAPVPVLSFERRFTVPGAAANPALNIQSLGGLALMAGVVGADEAGSALCSRLTGLGIETEGVIVDAARATTLKTRILAESSLRFPQQVVRVDRVEQRPLQRQVRRRLEGYLTEAVARCDAVLLSDYKGGVVEAHAVDVVLAVARQHGKLVAVDSQGDLHKFRGCDLVKCNQAEAQAFLRREMRADVDFHRGARLIQQRLGARTVVITRGSEGMSVVGVDGAPLHMPAANRSEVFDVTGAGDTVIAVLTLALAAGAPLPTAVGIANCAAGLVVRRLGNATLTPEELREAVEDENPCWE